VGLGKTIEAGIVIKQHVLETKNASRVILAVPEVLMTQWFNELTIRFHLGDVIDIGGEDTEALIYICAHHEILNLIELINNPTMLVVDEMHLVAPYAWSTDNNLKDIYNTYLNLANNSEVVLLLSGTPLNGNEKNFLAMLCCLSPHDYSLSNQGIIDFEEKVRQRELLGGLYSSIDPNSHNIVVRNNVNQIRIMFPNDIELQNKADQLLPYLQTLTVDEDNHRLNYIKQFKKYLGDHYKIHQRMLRNRHDDPQLSNLFPGLNGVQIQKIDLPQNYITLDELIDDYRCEAINNPKHFQCMGDDTYLEWLDLLLIAPVLISDKAQYLLNETKNIYDQEIQYLQQIKEIALLEQKLKDDTLKESLIQWLTHNTNGKVVVFCTKKSVADHVYQLLQFEYHDDVEQHISQVNPEFCKTGNRIKILVCDQNGEDGLNLHGGSKLAVHYSIPRSISRIEQRLGRLNRYSANLRGVRPIDNMVLIPHSDRVVTQWVKLLSETLNIFKKSVASLQYVLEEHLEGMWQEIIVDGIVVFDNSRVILEGNNGLIKKESQRVEVQHSLMSMDEDVQLAQQFSDEMIDADEVAEDQFKEMQGWITSVLSFKLQEHGEGKFRFEFIDNPQNGAITLVDVRTFLDNCFIGIDHDNGYPPTTHLMSPSRSLTVGNSNIYPFRYGQPFVDSIWNLLMSDSRGSCSAILRPLNISTNLPEPRKFFKFDWLLSADKNNVSFARQRKGDELMPPKLASFWLNEQGTIVTDQKAINFLNRPYDDNVDKNIRVSDWPQLTSTFPEDQWKSSVLNAEKVAMKEIDNLLSGSNIQTYHKQLISMHAVVLV
jgi:ATP-dependent helicase HepA